MYTLIGIETMRIGILGGGYFWKLWGKEHQTIYPETPYGLPADEICFGALGKHQVYTLQRHGFRHELDPISVPWKANVFAMFMQDLDFIIHVSVCGALNDKFQPGDIVLFDQILDFTKNRPLTFGPPVIKKVTHVNVAEPISNTLRKEAQIILKKNDIACHETATIVTEEGPRFSTNAEAKMFSMLGGDLINHTSATEVMLCNEIGLPVLAFVLVSNKIEIDKTMSDVGYEDISDNISKYRTIIPNAIRIFIENLENIKIPKPIIKPFNVKNLDLRGN